MKRGITKAKRKPLAVVVEPVVRQFEVVGAGRVQLSGPAVWRCGQAVGVSFEVSWTKYGMSGGVMDRSEMRKLRDYLNELLDVDHKPNDQNEPLRVGRRAKRRGQHEVVLNSLVRRVSFPSSFARIPQ